MPDGRQCQHDYKNQEYLQDLEELSTPHYESTLRKAMTYKIFLTMLPGRISNTILRTVRCINNSSPKEIEKYNHSKSNDHIMRLFIGPGFQKLCRVFEAFRVNCKANGCLVVVSFNKKIFFLPIFLRASAFVYRSRSVRGKLSDSLGILQVPKIDSYA